jgi:hypothetical protein
VATTTVGAELAYVIAIARPEEYIQEKEEINILDQWVTPGTD